MRVTAALPVQDECHDHWEQSTPAHAKHLGSRQPREGHHQHTVR